MFTGLVQAVGTVRSAETTAGGGLSLGISAPAWTTCPAPGDSIAVDGCCLTVVRASGQTGDELHLDFDVVTQTLNLTTIGGLAVGRRVNLETAATPDTLLGGHLVQGHVDEVAIVTLFEERGGETRLGLSAPAAAAELIIPQGSVTLSGVSLTVAAVDGRDFEIALIPTTLAETTLGGLRVGDRVNLETDMLLRSVRHLMQSRGLLNGEADPPE